MKLELYLPELSNQYVSTLGEQHFFKSKIWKLLVMFGESWKSIGWTLNGFTICNINGKSKFEHITSKLDELGINYKILYGSYQTRINISTRKANIELINKLYETYYINTMNRINNMQVMYKRNNFYMNDEMYNHYIQLSGKYHNAKEFIKLNK